MPVSKIYKKGVNRAQTLDGVSECGLEFDNIVQEIASMQTLFIAKIVSQKPLSTGPDEYDTITSATVEESLFGGIEAGDEIEIYHSKLSSAGIDFTVGSHPLISAYFDIDESAQFRLSADMCSNPRYTIEEYRAVLRGDGCRSQDQTQSIDFDPIGLKLVVLDEDGEITADEDRERLVMRIDSESTRVTDYWRG